MGYQYDGPKDEPVGESDETVKLEGGTGGTPRIDVTPPGQDDPNHAGKQRAQKMVSLIRQGRSRSQAAQGAGMTPQQAQQDPDVQDAMRTLLGEYEWKAEERRRIIRARMNKIILTGDDKDAVAASKVAGADPEVGLIREVPQVQVGIFGEATLDFLRRQGSDNAHQTQVANEKNVKELKHEEPAPDSGNTGR